MSSKSEISMILIMIKGRFGWFSSDDMIWINMDYDSSNILMMIKVWWEQPVSDFVYWPLGRHLILHQQLSIGMPCWPQLILVTTATTSGGVLFQAGVLFSSESAKANAFSKVYSENINTNPHIF